MRIGVILDATGLARWQADALQTMSGDAEFIIYSCTNSVPAKRRLRHAFYYLLNLLTIRNRLTRGVDWPTALRLVATRKFECEWEGAWQRFPAALLDLIAQDRPAVLLKFGMGLLRVPAAGQLAVPILSYHHGDPAQFRGRPAGFHELAAGETTIGQVVQLLSNELDAGRIVASAETRTFVHSYRATLIEAYRHSPLLLRSAVRNAAAGHSWEAARRGPVYRLPSNWAVVRFVGARFRNAVTRVAYGLLREKRWRVATAPVAHWTVEGVTERLADLTHWRAVPLSRGYGFLADPFFHPQEGLVVEGMNARSGRGEILHVTGGDTRRLSRRGGHFSYPAPIEDSGKWYVVPETSDWAPALAHPLVDTHLAEPVELAIPGRPRLLDPTPFRRGDTLYLFGNVAAEGPSVLRLWVSEGLERDFSEHPSSPIRMSPDGGRMAGIPFELDGRLIRVGQDLRGAYGDGISFFHITRIDPRAYAEELIGHFRFTGRRGPHTLNIGRGEIAFDYYADQFSVLAGLRRLRRRRAAGRVGS